MSQPKLNFSAEEDEKLVEVIAAHPLVHDVRHVLYKDQRVRENIWVVIAGEVGRSVGDCKKRWRNIKDTYSRKQSRENNETGDEAPPCKKGKKWALLERLSFLQASEPRRKRFCNVIEDTEDDVPQQESRPAFVTPRLRATSRDRSGSQSNESTENQKRADYRENTNERDPTIRDSRDGEPDDISLFFQSIVKTVKKFPPYLQQRAKLETLTLISKIETDMWSLHPGSSTNTQPFTSTSPCSTCDKSILPTASSQSDFL